MNLYHVKFIAASVALAITLFALAWSYPEHVSPLPKTSPRPHAEAPDNKLESKSGLATSALSKILDDAASIFGHYKQQSIGNSDWMRAYPDDTLLIHMNLPGTHDAATWNYSEATQEQLKPVTDLVNSSISFRPDNFRCQDTPLIEMLNAGIRVFDLRYALDPTKTAITFWHGPALQSQVATLENILFGFYKWLDDHPSEALLLSFQFEPSESMHNEDGDSVQRELYRILTNALAKKYIRQERDELGTLGDARGKVTLLRRFDLNMLPNDYEESTPGLHFSPEDWTVNGANTTLVYNQSPRDSASESGVAFIQDYYSPETPQDSSVEDNIDAKMAAILPHFKLARAEANQNSLFWHFMSATNIAYEPPITPKMMALGESSASHHVERADLDSVEGMNQRLLSALKYMKGKRLGIVMFDYFEQPYELLPLFLSLLPPP